MSEDREEAPLSASQTWDDILATLRRRYPGQKDSVLFCVLKLQENADLGLRDLRDQADMHGLALAPRSLHSARKLLGIGKEAAPRSAAAPAPTFRNAPRPARDGDSIEDQVLGAVRQIQESAQGRSERLRQAVIAAMAILRQALDDD
jgi:hypothetical protein